MTPPTAAALPARLLLSLVLTLGLGSATAAASPLAPLPAAAAAAKKPAVPSGLPSVAEGMSAYVPAVSCSPTTRPGTAKLGKLLTSTYPGTSYGASRSCGSSPNSEHHEGRAVDWMNSVRDDKQAAQAQAVIEWLFATDVQGNTYANARRLGVMYVIWDDKIWGAYSPDRGWRGYSTCEDHPEKSWDSTCHRDHMHLSLSWAGATGATSFWTKKVAAPDFGRCRPADLNWAYSYDKPNPTPCPRHPVVKPAAGSSALMKSLVTHSGRHLRKGATGAAVKVVQQAVKTPVTGTYSGATVTAVKAFQTSRKIRVTGTMNHTTWRALLQANAAK